MGEESKNGKPEDNLEGRRVFGVIARGYPLDIDAWIKSAQHHGIYVIFSKSSRVSKLIIKEEPW